MAFTDIRGRRENAGDSAVTGDVKRAGSMMTEGIDTTKMDMLNNLAGATAYSQIKDRSEELRCLRHIAPKKLWVMECREPV
jgi:hypothetical protein